MVSWVVNFRGFRSNKTRATHKTTVIIITGSNYASANNTIGSLIQFHCVHACMFCSTHANNPFHHRRKFQYRSGYASAHYLDKHYKVWDRIVFSLRALCFGPVSRASHACAANSRNATQRVSLSLKMRFSLLTFVVWMLSIWCVTEYGCELFFRFRKYQGKVSRTGSGKLIVSERFLHANEVAGVFIIFVKEENLTGIIEEFREFLPSNLFKLILLRCRLKKFGHNRKDNDVQSSKTEKVTWKL